jgi:hypothetical protein
MKRDYSVIVLLFILGPLCLYPVGCTKAGDGRANRSRTVELLYTLSKSLKAFDMEYQWAFDQYPFGSNAQILQTLRGKNPRKIIFLELSSQQVDSKSSQIIDSWNTPIRFTSRPDALPAICSAGPDRRFDTRDDLKPNE